MEGIRALKEELRTSRAYPVVHGRPPPGGLGCPACHNCIRKDSPSHTRNPATCRWYDIEPIIWECQACDEDKNRKDSGHMVTSPGKCRFAPPLREAGVPRTGAHPRDPRPRAVSHPSADASALDAQQYEEDMPGRRISSLSASQISSKALSEQFCSELYDNIII